jgi:hypothetical protein
MEGCMKDCVKIRYFPPQVSFRLPWYWKGAPAMAPCGDGWRLGVPLSPG